ncbi:GNAT family N-acetyltransferase [Bacillus spongiae]|uniref:GNAT family N-acetyltransferase n=1 Tax=Bacillus spongiae TaxID=2683610 RepID=A0ABU8HFB9_9BACI
MASVELVKHNLNFCKCIYELSSAKPVKEALGLPDGSIDNTKEFIKSVIQEEQEGKTLSRVILDENSNVIGITTLMSINNEKKSCHVGTWIGFDYWGKGYNEASKIVILKIAFEDLGLEKVFAGARKINIRSQKAQEKLPFIRLYVENEFPEEHAVLEEKEKQSCVLHAFFKDDFINYLHGTNQAL